MTQPAIHFTVSAPDPHTHLFHVTLQVARPAAQQVLTLPTWIPGSYLIREFAGQLQSLQARQGQKACAVQQLDKHRWQVACAAGKPLEVSYQVYACDTSVRTAWLDAERGFFNATSLCLMVDGQTDAPQHITITSPNNRQWQLATGLQAVRADAKGFGQYVAADYDELADCPVEMGAFWSAEFTACGVPHRFVIAHPLPSMDGERLLQDTRRICETIIRFWHGQRATAKQVPFKRYVFMLNAVGDGYGGLEHRNSTALIASRSYLPQNGQTPGADYVTLLGLISHEYFHTWNVKRLKPAEFAPYDYTRENYTELLWFFEGLTSYYDDLLLLRAGCVDLDGYSKQLQKTIDNVYNSPGRLVHSVAQASFEAWTKHYRPDAGTPNRTVSYYTKGALVGLCLDLTLRREGKTTLDAVMRALYARCKAAPGPFGGMTEQDVLAVLQELGGRSFAKEIKAWVHGTAELPLPALLKGMALELVQKEAELAQQWGLRCKEGPIIQVQAVLRGGVAEAAGFAPGDEWWGVEQTEPTSHAPAIGWRVGRLADVKACLPLPSRPGSATGKKAKQAASAKSQLWALVARDRRLLRLPLHLSAQAPQRWALQAKPPASKGDKQPKHWPWV
ncbi:MAG: peptidase M61 [Brachymonas sp.]|nr:peptidase M61 [Brachymonas sp.]